MKMNRTEKITSEGTWKPKDLGHSDEAVDPRPVTPGWPIKKKRKKSDPRYFLFFSVLAFARF